MFLTSLRLKKNCLSYIDLFPIFVFSLFPCAKNFRSKRKLNLDILARRRSEIDGNIERNGKREPKEVLQLVF